MLRGPFWGDDCVDCGDAGDGSADLSQLSDTQVVGWSNGPAGFSRIDSNRVGLLGATKSLALGNHITYVEARPGALGYGLQFYAHGQQTIGLNLHGLVVAQPKAIGFSQSTSTTYSAPDTKIEREAAGHIVQRNAANPQAFSIANTDDGTNYERGGMWWSGDICYVGTTAGGTGSARRIYLDGADGSYLRRNGVTYIATLSSRIYAYKPFVAGAGFAAFGASVVTTQPSAIADATDSATTQSKLNEVLGVLRDYGLIAT